MPTMTIVQLIEERKREMTRIREEILYLEKAAGVAGANGNGSIEPRKTILQMAEAVLRAAKEPMKTRAICEAIQSQFGSYVKPQSLGTMLYRVAQNSKRAFVRDKNDETMYGLRDWRK